MRGLLLVCAAVPLAAGPLRIYVANSDGDNITVIDPAANRVAGEIKVSRNPHGIVPSPDGARFYVSSESEDVLDVVDRGSSRIVRRVPLGRRPNNVAVTPDGRYVYVCIRQEGVVDVVDTRSLERVKRIEAGRQPHNIYPLPDGRHMLATAMDDHWLAVIDTDRMQTEYKIPVGGVPRPVAIESEGGAARRLFVQLSSLHGFAVVDFGSRRVVDKVLLPDGPPGAKPLIPYTFSHGIGISPDRRTLWVTSLLDDSVSVFGMPDLERLATIKVGHGPDWLTFTPDGARCYVSNAGSNSVSAIDVAARKELAQIPVGRIPKRIIAAE